MITHIELDGFKTFLDFSLELAPFQVIVGPNGAGKSNLFDALRLLSLLADADLRSAFGELRGEAGELFTALPDGESSSRMLVAVDMLVERSVRDSWGAQAELKHPRLRYALEIVRHSDEHGLERLYVTHESLVPIRREDDAWLKRHIRGAKDAWLPALKRGRKEPFISTDSDGGMATIHLHQDGHGGRKASIAEKIERTVLSGVTNTEFPHAFAAREEMRNWRFLQLNPEVLRQPSSMLSHSVVASDGSNLPSALARMESEDPHLLNDVSRDLANLVPGILNVEIERDLPRNRFVIHARTQDGRAFSSRVLSDGTLRLLALVALKNDPNQRGVLLFEEPENGVHPFRLANMVDLLHDLATDFRDPMETEAPLRQLLINTHSPVFVNQLVNRLDNDAGLLFAYLTTRVEPGHAGAIRVTHIAPVDSARQQRLDLDVDPEQSYTYSQVIDYLNTTDFGEARARLMKVTA